MVLLESSEGRKRAPWMLQLVFNKILTFPLESNFGLRNMAVVVVGKGGVGLPPLLFTLKAIPFQANSSDCGRVSLHDKHILHSIDKICNGNDYNIVIN